MATPITKVSPDAPAPPSGLPPLTRLFVELKPWVLSFHIKQYSPCRTTSGKEVLVNDSHIALNPVAAHSTERILPWDVDSQLKPDAEEGRWCKLSRQLPLPEVVGAPRPVATSEDFLRWRESRSHPQCPKSGQVVQPKLMLVLGRYQEDAEEGCLTDVHLPAAAAAAAAQSPPK